MTMLLEPVLVGLDRKGPHQPERAGELEKRGCALLMPRETGFYSAEKLAGDLLIGSGADPKQCPYGRPEFVGIELEPVAIAVFWSYGRFKLVLWIGNRS